MIVRYVLLLILLMLVARAFWRVVDNIVEAAGGRSPRGGAGVSQPGVQMVRDPVCGTFVVRDRAVTLDHGKRRFFFCSDACREKYRARIA